jgi:hypothetical protein
MCCCTQTNRKKICVRKRVVPLLFKPKICVCKRVVILCANESYPNYRYIIFFLSGREAKYDK